MYPFLHLFLLPPFSDCIMVLNCHNYTFLLTLYLHPVLMYPLPDYVTSDLYTQHTVGLTRSRLYANRVNELGEYILPMNHPGVLSFQLLIISERECTQIGRLHNCCIRLPCVSPQRQLIHVFVRSWYVCVPFPPPPSSISPHELFTFPCMSVSIS